MGLVRLGIGISVPNFQAGKNNSRSEGKLSNIKAPLEVWSLRTSFPFIHAMNSHARQFSSTGKRFLRRGVAVLLKIKGSPLTCKNRALTRSHRQRKERNTLDLTKSCVYQRILFLTMTFVPNHFAGDPPIHKHRTSTRGSWFGPFSFKSKKQHFSCLVQVLPTPTCPGFTTRVDRSVEELWSLL